MSSRIEITRAVRVSKAFGAVTALRGVDLTARAGEMILLEGPNGSGKSTLLGVLGGLVRPSGGEVVYGPALSRQDVRSQIGWVAHDILAYPDLSVRANLRFVASVFGMDPEHAFEDAARRFGIDAFADRPIRNCSRGQRQRLSLARALLGSPSLLLLDEPTTGLDRAGIELLVGVLREEVENGAAVIVSTHEPQAFAGTNHNKVVLERGRVVKAPPGPTQ